MSICDIVILVPSGKAFSGALGLLEVELLPQASNRGLKKKVLLGVGYQKELILKNLRNPAAPGKGRVCKWAEFPEHFSRMKQLADFRENASECPWRASGNADSSNPAEKLACCFQSRDRLPYSAEMLRKMRKVGLKEALQNPEHYMNFMNI